MVFVHLKPDTLDDENLMDRGRSTALGAAAFVTWAALGIAVAILVSRFAGRSSRARRAFALGPLALTM